MQPSPQKARSKTPARTDESQYNSHIEKAKTYEQLYKSEKQRVKIINH